MARVSFWALLIAMLGFAAYVAVAWSLVALVALAIVGGLGLLVGLAKRLFAPIPFVAMGLIVLAYVWSALQLRGAECIGECTAWQETVLESLVRTIAVFLGVWAAWVVASIGLGASLASLVWRSR